MMESNPIAYIWSFNAVKWLQNNSVQLSNSILPKRLSARSFILSITLPSVPVASSDLQILKQGGN